MKRETVLALQKLVEAEVYPCIPSKGSVGASGDLAARLLFPALLSLEKRERLENLKVIGYARQDWTSKQFQDNLRAAIDRSDPEFDEKYCDFGFDVDLAYDVENLIHQKWGEAQARLIKQD